EGDSVSNGEILAEIETDKAVMELVARGEGVLRKVLIPEGATAPVGEVIALIAGPDEDISSLLASAERVTSSPPGDPSPEVAAPGAPEEASEVRDQEDEAVVDSGGGEAAPRSTGLGGRVRASPLARRLAREADMDLQRVHGSGPGGRIVKRDVEEAKAGVGAASMAPDPGQGAEVGTASVRAPGVDFEDMPLSQMRKTIAKRLVESLGPVPHFFLRITADMSRTLEARKRVNRLLEAQGDKVSINDFILKATANALERHPEVNAQWTGDAIRRHYRVHLAVAVAVDDGLITPVIRDANRKGLAQIAREVRELAALGREKKLRPEEYTGSTFSVSNLGMFGIHEFTGVINPPEAGIIAVGGIEDTPVVEDGQVAVRPLMKVTMSCDHRVIDGATGARFLQTLKEMLEEPATILV
ncbi:MAG: 2-oxo acid dehydrogenase subunit E2, partial [Longimicrobiales bacterium]|nr:2-oxo acid dehydrogenase subunit E2 [Longimicrobiales bacterium]